LFFIYKSNNQSEDYVINISLLVNKIVFYFNIFRIKKSYSILRKTRRFIKKRKVFIIIKQTKTNNKNIKREAPKWLLHLPRWRRGEN